MDDLSRIKQIKKERVEGLVQRLKNNYKEAFDVELAPEELLTIFNEEIEKRKKEMIEEATKKLHMDIGDLFIAKKDLEQKIFSSSLPPKVGKDISAITLNDKPRESKQPERRARK